MRKYKFTGREAIGYNRLIRPGSILGPQQQYLVSKEQEMWALGDPDLPPKRERCAAAGGATGKKLLPSRIKLSSRSPGRTPHPASSESKSKARRGVAEEAAAIASKILAQENTDAMNRRAAQMSAAAGAGGFSRVSSTGRVADGVKKQVDKVQSPASIARCASK